MNDFFIKKYSLILNNNSFLERIKYYSVKRFLIRFLANIFVPIWFFITNLFDKKRLSENNRDRKVIVSLTSFPARINRLWIVVECMFRQTYSADIIVLWLSKEQFKGLESLPKNLLKLQKRGLEIEFCDGDLRSHKKYYYALKKYPKDIIITIDDDVFYHSKLISDLIDAHSEFPNSVCCNRASRIIIKDGIVSPYNDWEYIWNKVGPDYNVFPTGCGGVLYPSGALNEDVFNEEIFMKYCMYADDIWLYFMAQLNNTKLVKTNATNELIPIFNRGDVKLTSINVDNGLNDIQLNEARDYYIKNKKIDPLINILKLI